MTSRSLDKFYTKSHIVETCISTLNKLNITVDKVLEPSAGNGSWSLLFPNCIACDIKPEHPSITEMDFLQETIDLKNFQNVMAIGNPPFGRQCSLAVRFFNRCAGYPQVNTIAMIFPKSFRKISIQSRLDLNFHLVSDNDLESDVFLLDNADWSVPCVFQIWIRKTEKRVIEHQPVLHSDKIQFSKTGNIRAELPTASQLMAVRRVGWYAGKASLFNNQSKESHYFLIVSDAIVDSLMEYLNTIEWEHNDTTGPRSISKRQLIPVLNGFALYELLYIRKLKIYNNIFHSSIDLNNV